jgi:hypothetical protein
MKQWNKFWKLKKPDIEKLKISLKNTTNIGNIYCSYFFR